MFRLSEQVRSTHNREGGVVLEIRHGRIFRLNSTGSRMLELLKQGHSEEEIANQVSREFGATREIASSDLREFLIHLAENQIVEFHPRAIRSA
jgi:hypothetical protein